MVALRYHRTSSRVLWDLYVSDCRRLEPLHRDLAALVEKDERPWLQSGGTFSIRARNLQGFPAGARQVVGAVKNALITGAAARGSEVRVAPENPDRLVTLRMHNDELIISIDLDGRSRHERGYRQESGDAPLRENLAAALVMLARYDARSDVLVDPMAGSGTIAIEAALMAVAAPLRTARGSALEWPCFAEAMVPSEPLFADTRPRVSVVEIEKDIARIAGANARAAGVVIDVRRGDFRTQPPPALTEGQTGLIITNPPYGRRLGGDVEALHRDLAQWCKSARGYRAAILVEDPSFERHFGFKAKVKKPLSNASARTYFYLFAR